MKKITKNDRLKFTDKAKEILDKLTLEEKARLMTGMQMNEEEIKLFQDQFASGEIQYNEVPYPASGNKKHNIPEFLFCDGPRGVVCGKNQSTCFPTSILRGASFDKKLEEEIGKAIGEEIRSHGGNYFGGVCINLPYHPGWGRSQETYGEESYALGQMGSALVRGVQSQAVIACIKHFAFNSMENSRFKVSVECDRRTEREVYLPHFKDCIDAGAASVMCSYNLYQGVPVSASNYLQRKILKEEWDFDGFVISDFVLAIRDAVGAVNGGLDVEMPFQLHFGQKLIDAVNQELIPMKYIDDSCLRIIRTMLAFDSEIDKSKIDKNNGWEAHSKLALKSAQEGITLLQNKNNLLPLNKNSKGKIMVLGHLANKANTGDNGSSRIHKDNIATPLMCLKNIAPDIEFEFKTYEQIDEVKKIANIYDQIIFVLGFDSDDEGEFIEGDNGFSIGGDRKNNLRIHEKDLDFIKQIAPLNQNTIVVLNGGNTIIMSEWANDVSSILMAFYSGENGAKALAQIIFGDVNPSGKLPYVQPFNEEDLPDVKWDTTSQYYEYYHGYARLEKNGIKPALPYGFGLSYTDFSFKDFVVTSEGSEYFATVKVKNIGKVFGDEVVQLYIGFENSKIDRPLRLLRGFERISLKPGEEKEVRFLIDLEKLKWYNPSTSKFELENITYNAYVGNCLNINTLLKDSFTV